jgi:isopentenyldiphosphate isomerase
VLQQRAPGKDTWPGAWDVSAAGHYRPGEGLEGGLRELQEELGLVVEAEALTWGWRQREVIHYASGLWDREFHDVYLLRCDLSLDVFRPDSAEVVGLVALPAAHLVGLARGAIASLRPTAWRVNGGQWVWTPVHLRRSKVVPRVGRYYERVARLAARLVALR